MTSVACGVRNAYTSGTPDFTSSFHIGSCCPVICVSLFLVIVWSFWILSFDCSLCLIAWYLYILLIIWSFGRQQKVTNVCHQNADKELIPATDDFYVVRQ